MTPTTHRSLSADWPRPAGPGSQGLLRSVPSAIGIFRDPIGFVSRRFDAYGDIYYVPNGDGGLYVLRHPDHVGDVLVTHASKFDKSHTSSSQLAEFLGNALLTNEGEAWRRQRRMVGPAFHRDRLSGYAEIMVEESVRTVRAWRGGEERDMAREMMSLTLRIVDRTLFGRRVDDAEIAEVARSVNTAQRSLWLPGALFSLYRRRVHHARRNIDRILSRRIDARRQTPGSGEPDLLDALLRAVDVEGDGRGLSDRELHDLVATFFVAGHETTALALTWSLYLLSQNPDAGSKLSAEVDAVLAGRTVTYDDLPKLVYTRRVLQEAMRLYPPAFAIARRARDDARIGDYIVPAGSEVVIWIYMMHRHPRFYPEPERFDPERFTEESEARRPKHAYLPFGGGARVCIGKAFAMLEAELVLATLVQRFRFELVRGHRVQARPRITLGPKYGMRMVLQGRA
ncbi:cytochrome P450 [Pendulispora albinea]|uniref:Cytochrome P450 n=1 Tax=Pendulispora albinea TaxID=2741071 RepID=A0ABZ2M8B9_9BACT